MKTLVKISLLLLFFSATANAQNTQSKLGAVAVHELELLPGVDAKEFETFVLENIIPVYNKMQGQQAMLAKGDRGVRTNMYTLILTFDSLEDRNRIYPPEGGMVGDFGEDSMWEKFMTMVEGIGETFTDYIKI